MANVIKKINTGGTTYPIDRTFTVTGLSTVAGNGTSGSYLSVRWYNSGVEGLTAPYDGMRLLIKIPLAGVGTAGAMLSINGNNAADYHPLAYNNTTVLTTHYAVNTYKLFVYDASASMTVYKTSNTSSTVTGVWKAESNYVDGNSYAYVRQYQAGANAAGTTGKYPILTRYNVTNKNGTYDTAYSRFYTDTYIDTSNGYLYAPALYENGTALSTKYQAALVSGTNIKTINGNSILGSGDLTISGGGGSGDVSGPSSSTNNAIAVFDGITGKAIKNTNVTLGSNSGSLLTTDDIMPSVGSTFLIQYGTVDTTSQNYVYTCPSVSVAAYDALYEYVGTTGKTVHIKGYMNSESNQTWVQSTVTYNGTTYNSVTIASSTPGAKLFKKNGAIYIWDQGTFNVTVYKKGTDGGIWNILNGISSSDLVTVGTLDDALSAFHLYEHNIAFSHNGSYGSGGNYKENITLTCRILASDKTAVTTVGTLATLLYNGGYTSSTKRITASGRLLKSSNSGTNYDIYDIVGVGQGAESGSYYYFTVYCVKVGSLNTSNNTYTENSSNTVTTVSFSSTQSSTAVTDYVVTLI